MLEIYNRKRCSLIINDIEFISSVSILTLLMFAMPPNMQGSMQSVVDGEWEGKMEALAGFIYGFRLEAGFACHTLCPYKSQFWPYATRLMYDFGLIFVEHVRRKCV